MVTKLLSKIAFAILFVSCSSQGAAVPGTDPGTVQPARFRAPGYPPNVPVPYNAIVDGVVQFATAAPEPVTIAKVQSISPPPQSIVIYRTDVTTASVQACLADSPQSSQSPTGLFLYSVNGSPTWQQPPQSLAPLLDDLAIDVGGWYQSTYFVFDSSLDPQQAQAEQPTITCFGTLGATIQALH